MKFFEQAGKMALGSRVRILGEKIAADAAEVYSLYGVDLEPKWFPVFYMLSRGGEKTITTVAEAIGHSHVSVSKIAREMKKAGLTREKADPVDGRRTFLALSKAGREIARKIEAQYVDVNAAVEELAGKTRHDLWAALAEWEELLQAKSLLHRVREQKKQRESRQVVIEPYRAKHHAAFRRLNEEWITKYFKMEKPDHDALDYPKKYILDRGGFIFVASLQGQTVGVCALMKRDDIDAFELAKMAVAPSARGKRVGWLLGQAVVTKARELQAHRVFVESNTVLKPAIELYRKLGFRETKGPVTPYERCNIQMELILG